MFGKIKNYLIGVKEELAKVNWPKRREVIHYTVIVIVSSLIAMLVVIGIDWLLSKGVELFINKG